MKYNQSKQITCIIFIAVMLNFILSCNVTKRTSINRNQCIYTYDSSLAKLVYTYVEVMPKYPGSETGMLAFIGKNYKYPDQEDAQFNFFIEFVIDSSGKLIAPRFINKRSADLTAAEKEMLRVVNAMPKWNPGLCGGKKVAVKMSFPIWF